MLEVDALDWDTCLEILVAYRVEPRTLQLLWTYWEHLTMVARDGGYFGLLFKGYHGVTQGAPPVPAALQCGCVIRHAPLGDSGGANQGGYVGTWIVYKGLDGVFLCRRRYRRLEPTGEAIEGVQRPHRPLRPGRPQNEYAEDGEHGLPSMPHAWHDVGGGVC